jgi:uncharacterized membrane protein
LQGECLTAAFALGIVPFVAPQERCRGGARRRRARAHKITMLSVFAGALTVAGLFTLVPGP